MPSASDRKPVLVSLFVEKERKRRRRKQKGKCWRGREKYSQIFEGKRQGGGGRVLALKSGLNYFRPSEISMTLMARLSRLRFPEFVSGKEFCAILLQRSDGRTRLDCRTNSKAAARGGRKREGKGTFVKQGEKGGEGGDGIELFCLGRNSFLFSLLSLRRSLSD